MESLRPIEYDEQEEDYETEYEDVLAVELFYNYYGTDEIKENIELFLEAKNLDNIEI